MLFLTPNIFPGILLLPVITLENPRKWFLKGQESNSVGLEDSNNTFLVALKIGSQPEISHGFREGGGGKFQPTKMRHFNWTGTSYLHLFSVSLSLSVSLRDNICSVFVSF